MIIGIVCYPTFGGSGVVATELGLAFSKKGHQVHFITYKQPVRLELLSANVHFHEVHVPDYPLFHYQPYELALSSKLVDTVKEFDIEILHVHYAIPHAYAAYMAKKMLLEEGINIPIVTTLHGTDITLVGSHPFYKTAVAFSINNSDIVTAVSENLKKDTKRLFAIEREIKVVSNFIDIDKYNPEPHKCNRRLLAEPDEKIITHISNFRPVKRIHDVISIFYIIHKSCSSKLVLIGEGPMKEAATRQCEDLGITDRVIFLGNTNEVQKVLCCSDLFLLPSETESFGLAALEAMASGVPVISSDSGGIPELNINGVSGFVCPVGAVDKMAAKALAILNDDLVLQKFKIEAQKIASNFDIHTVMPKYEFVYAEALKNFNRNLNK